jgi:hypothetical protein
VPTLVDPTTGIPIPAAAVFSDPGLASTSTASATRVADDPTTSERSGDGKAGVKAAASASVGSTRRPTRLPLGARLGSSGGSECLAAVASGAGLPTACTRPDVAAESTTSSSGILAHTGAAIAMVVALGLIVTLLGSALWSSARARRAKF